MLAPVFPGGRSRLRYCPFILDLHLYFMRGILCLRCFSCYVWHKDRSSKWLIAIIFSIVCTQNRPTKFFVHQFKIVDENYGYGLDEIQLMTDFGYTSQPNLPYPTCALKKGINTKFDQAGLSNFVFLAGLAYSYPNQTQLYLGRSLCVSTVCSVNWIHILTHALTLSRSMVWRESSNQWCWYGRPV